MRINTPDQTKAISKIMASRRAAWRNDGRTVADFPEFYEGMTTANYIGEFIDSRHNSSYGKGLAKLIPCGYVFADRAAPYITGAEVTAETVEPVDIGAACLERFGVSDPLACAHLPVFADWLNQLEAA